VFDPSMVEVACSTDCGGDPCRAPDACVAVANADAGEYLVRLSQQGGGAGADGAGLGGGFSLSVVVDACPADVDDDDIVGFADLLAVLSAWGECSGPCPADVNEDGNVGFADLLVVLATWGAC
jgi:hypothetical protein